MLMRIRKPYWIVLGSVVMLAGILIVLQYGGVWKFKEIAVGDEPLKKEIAVVEQYKDQNIMSVPLDQIADELFKNKRIVKVDLGYDFPDKISVQYNNLVPIALIALNNGRQLFSIDDKNRLIPFDDDELNVPVITGVKSCRAYTISNNKNLVILTEELIRIRDDFNDFYLSISGINIKKESKITVYLDGISFGIETYSGKLYQSIKKLKLFLNDYNPSLDGIKRLDMRLDNAIIAAG